MGKENTGMSSNTILLVEDTPSLARLYNQYLEGEDLTVIAVGTGKEALKEISENPPDAVLLDLRLPDMDGLDILKEIRSRELPCEVVGLHELILRAIDVPGGLSARERAKVKPVAMAS